MKSTLFLVLLVFFLESLAQFRFLVPVTLHLITILPSFFRWLGISWMILYHWHLLQTVIVIPMEGHFPGYGPTKDPRAKPSKSISFMYRAAQWGWLISSGQSSRFFKRLFPRCLSLYRPGAGFFTLFSKEYVFRKIRIILLFLYQNICIFINSSCFIICVSFAIHFTLSLRQLQHSDFPVYDEIMKSAYKTDD